MSLYPYSIKNYSSDDFEKLAIFCRDAQLFDQSGYESPLFLLEKILRRPQYSPHLDLFLAKWNEDMVGFLNLTPELRIGRVILNGFVNPGHRRLGLATEMLCSALKRAEALKGKVVHVCLSEGNTAGQSLMKKWCFSPVRHFLNLQINLAKDLKKEADQIPDQFDHFLPGKEARLAALQNRCFAGTWGFCPNTAEEIKYYLDLTDSRLKDVLAARTRKNENIIGYCWTQMLTRAKTARSGRKGRIHMFGVDPNYQGKGIGKALLIEGLHYLKNKGAEDVELTVDKKNKGALALYSSLGFKRKSVSIWYEKGLESYNK